MRIFWEDVIEPLLKASAARTVVEIGVQAGATTELLATWVRRHDGTVHAVDPDPEIDIERWEQEHGRSLKVHKERSLDVLGQIRGIDAVLIDGDHNWYTVFSELSLLADQAGSDERPLPLICVHDVEWPYARRDMYYDPESIPQEFRHEAKQAGIHPDHSSLQPAGINAWLWNATHEGGSRNGVLTAIEDFMASHEDLCEMITIPGAGGLAVLVDHERLASSPALSRELDRMQTPELLRRQVGTVEDRCVRTEVRLRTIKARNEELDRHLAEIKSMMAALERELGSCRERLDAARTSAEAALEEVVLLNRKIATWVRAAREIEGSRAWRVGNLLVRALRLITFRSSVASKGPAELAAEIEATLKLTSTADRRSHGESP